MDWQLLPGRRPGCERGITRSSAGAGCVMVAGVTTVRSPRRQVDMHTHDTEGWAHSHVFDQDRKRPAETRTLIVVLVTAQFGWIAWHV